VGGWRRLHEEAFQDLYASVNITVIKSRRMRWARNVARLGQINAYNIFVGKN